MSWITKRKEKGKIRRIYRWRDSGGRREKLMPAGITAKEAKALQHKWDLQRAVKERSAKVQPWTLEKAKEMVLAAHDYSPGYQRNLNIYWQAAMDHWGKDRRLNTIGVTDVLIFVKTLRQNKKATTVSHYVKTLSVAAGLAMEEGMLDSNPFLSPRVKRQLPNDANKRDRKLTEAEIRRLLEFSDGNLRTWLVIALATGGRHTEILTLSWEDVDFEQSTITFHHKPAAGKRTKNKRTKTVPINQAALGYLTALREKSGGKGWLIPGRQGHVCSMKTPIQRAAQRAKVPGVTAHVIRHTVASHLSKMGAAPATVRDILGHSDLRMTSDYTHTFDVQARVAAESLTTLMCVENIQKGGEKGGEEDLQKVIEENPKVSKALNRFLLVLERETGLEPATLSLGRFNHGNYVETNKVDLKALKHILRKGARSA